MGTWRSYHFPPSAAMFRIAALFLPQRDFPIRSYCQGKGAIPTCFVGPTSYPQNVNACGSRSRVIRGLFLKSLYKRGEKAVCNLALGSTGCACASQAVDFSESLFLNFLRFFGTQRVVQKRRHQMRILHPLQTPYVHHEGFTRPPPIPHSLTATGTIKRLLNCNSVGAKDAASRINWEAYISYKRGVRWHPQGAWRVQFTRRNHERNFFVRCECYFKVSDYGFETAKELAIRYRERLEREWEELRRQWNNLDVQEARARMFSKTGVDPENEQLLLPQSGAHVETTETDTRVAEMKERRTRADIRADESLD